jgi:hypothetical protein
MPPAECTAGFMALALSAAGLRGHPGPPIGGPRARRPRPTAPQVLLGRARAAAENGAVARLRRDTPHRPPPRAQRPRVLDPSTNPRPPSRRRPSAEPDEPAAARSLCGFEDSRGQEPSERGGGINSCNGRSICSGGCPSAFRQPT